MKKIGITGQNGFIGSHLYRWISILYKNFKLIEFNREIFESQIELDEFVSSCDIIVHLAGINRHDDENYIYLKNLELTNKLIDSFIRVNFNGLVIFSSSIQENRANVFGKVKKKSRLLFSKWANDNNGKFVGLIIPNVFGAFGLPFYNSVISTFCHQLTNKQPTEIQNDATLSLIYIDDLIKKIIDFTNSESNKIVIIKHTIEIKVSKILEILNNFNHTYFLNGVIPKFNSNFELNLFNTFRSYIDLEKYFPVKYKNNIDNRGNFVEIIKLRTGGQVSFSTTKENVTRGNHFHSRKIERFSVIKGDAIIKLRKFGSEKVTIFSLNGKNPSYVDMPIWYSHSITNTGSDDLYTIFWINEFYNENDPDTYFEKV